jgi:RNA polymerase sigma-70 factor (ECF subfamily)
MSARTQVLCRRRPIIRRRCRQPLPPATPAPALADTDWDRIVALYDGLAQLMPSPVIELNRAVAVGMAFGPQAALEIVNRLREEPALDSYHLLPSVRGDLLEKLGHLDQARAEFERAALLTANSRQRAKLLERAVSCAPQR